MPNSLADRLTGLSPDTWILTETVWQARALQGMLAEKMRTSGAQAWERPFILPWDQAWPLLWDRLPLALPTRLSGLQERALWRRVIQEAHPQDWLLDADRSARLAQQARSVLLQWKMPDIDPFAGPLSEEAEHFLVWHRAYERMLAASAWVDRAALPDALAAQLLLADNETMPIWRAQLPQHILTYAVDLLRPQRQRLLHALQAVQVFQGQAIAVEALPLWQADEALAGACHATQAACVDADAERLQVAHWLRGELECSSESGIGDVPQAAWHGRRWLWVIPDLAQTRAATERVLRSVFQPQHVASLSFDPAPLWRFGVVQTLAEAQPVQAILQLLRLGQGAITLNDFGVLLRSPWWIDEAERAAVVALDVRLRKEGEPRLTLHAALVLLDECPTLQRIVATLLEGLASIQGVQSTALWAEQIEQFARASLWTPLFMRIGEDAGRLQQWSVVRDAWNEALDQLAALQVVEPAPGYAQMLSLLARAVENVPMPEVVSEAPIWVCSPQDAIGVPADAVWVSGVREDRWSVVPRVHPMLPIAWARNLPIYRSDVMLAEADAQLEQWIKSGAIFSWPQYESEIELSPIAAVASLPLASEMKVVASTLSEQLLGTLPVDSNPDYAPVLQHVAISGGASAFQHQSLCPFRGFVRARLGVQALEEGHGGLDARERGTILHKALQAFWERFPRERRTQKSLYALSEATLEQWINDAVDAALQMLHAKRSLTLAGRFMLQEQQRLCQALQKLIVLDLDEGRAPFRIVEVEDRRRVSFAGLQFNIQRDRVEEVDQQRHMVIDYKTGSVSASDWYGDRPKNPQLPLYAVLEAREGHALAGVLFAQYREGDWKFSGEWAESSLLPKDAISKRKPIEFSEALPEWEVALTNLADELRHGVARIDPQSNACQFCGLQAVCRIDPWQEAAEIEGDVA
jgi:ATP-dependent helicase/nuclease subunit B